MDNFRARNDFVAPMPGFEPGGPYRPGAFVTQIGQRISYLIFKVLEIQRVCFINVHQNNALMVAGLADRYNRWRQKYTLLVTQVYMLAQGLYHMSHFEDHKNAWNGIMSLRQRENHDESRWHYEAYGLACAQIELAIEIREEIAPKPVDESFRAKQTGFGTVQRSSSVRSIEAGKPASSPLKPDFGTVQQTSSPSKGELGTMQRTSSVRSNRTRGSFGTPRVASSPLKGEFGSIQRTSSVQPSGTPKSALSPLKPDFGTVQQTSSAQPTGSEKATSSPSKGEFGTVQRTPSVQPTRTPKSVPSPLKLDFGTVQQTSSVQPIGSEKATSSPLKGEFGSIQRTSSVQPSGTPKSVPSPLKPDFGTAQQTSSAQPTGSRKPSGTGKQALSPSTINPGPFSLEGGSNDFQDFFQSLDEIPVTWGRPPVFNGPDPEVDLARVEQDVKRLKELLWRQRNQQFWY